MRRHRSRASRPRGSRGLRRESRAVQGGPAPGGLFQVWGRGKVGLYLGSRPPTPATLRTRVGTYDTLDGGDYAARMYDTERNIIAQYGVMGENDWAMLDEWGRSCPPSSPPGGASPKAGAYAAMAVGGVVILGCLVAHRHHILHCVSPCTGEDCRPRLLTRLLATRRASTTPTAQS